MTPAERIEHALTGATTDLIRLCDLMTPSLLARLTPEESLDLLTTVQSLGQRLRAAAPLVTELLVEQELEARHLQAADAALDELHADMAAALGGGR